MLRRLLAAIVVVVPVLATAPAAAAEPDIKAALRVLKRLDKDFRKAYETTHGKGVTVAVLSTGVARNVRTLSGKVKKGRNLVKLGKPARVYGTLVASLIAGRGPDHKAFGIKGLAPGVRILPVRVHPDEEDASRSRLNDWYAENDTGEILARGIRHSVKKGASVIMLAHMGEGEKLEKAIKDAAKKNVVVVTGAFDVDRDSDADPPAGMPGVLTAGGVRFDGKRAPVGRARFPKSETVLVAGIGDKQLTTGPGNRLYQAWGPGMAAAWVAATAALIKAEHPDMGPGRVAQAIAASARKKGKGYNTSVGFGVVNPGGALKEAKKLAKLPDEAEPGLAATDPGSHVGGGRPENIRAVQYDMTKLGGFGGLGAAGLVLLLVAVARMVRRRSRRDPGIATHAMGGPGAG